MCERGEAVQTKGEAVQTWGLRWALVITRPSVVSGLPCVGSISCRTSQQRTGPVAHAGLPLPPSLG